MIGALPVHCAIHLKWLAVVFQLCSRKKDHGRAEALLLSAWGAGYVMTDDLLQKQESQQQMNTDGYGNLLVKHGAEAFQAAAAKVKKVKEPRTAGKKQKRRKEEQEATSVVEESIAIGESGWGGR